MRRFFSALALFLALFVGVSYATEMPVTAQTAMPAGIEQGRPIKKKHHRFFRKPHLPWRHKKQVKEG